MSLVHFLTKFYPLLSDVQKYDFESALGYVFCASDVVAYGVDENSNDTLAMVPVQDMHILVCQWWGKTVSTDLKSVWNLQ